MEVYRQALFAAVDAGNKSLLEQVSPEIAKLKSTEIKSLIKDLEKQFSIKQISWLHVNLNENNQIALSSEEAEERLLAENNIKGNSRDYVVKGESLKAIRDKKLYRDNYFTFEQYCKAVFQIDENTSRKWMLSSQIYNKLRESFPEEQLPANFYIASELIPVRTVPVEDFWTSILERSEQLGVEITGRFVSKMYAQLRVDTQDIEVIPVGSIVAINHYKHNAQSRFRMWGRVEDFEQGRYHLYVGKPKLLSSIPLAVERMDEEEIHNTVIELSMREDKFISGVAQSFFLFQEYNDAEINYIKQLAHVNDGY
jgi:hypothetical protein